MAHYTHTTHNLLTKRSTAAEPNPPSRRSQHDGPARAPRAAHGRRGVRVEAGAARRPTRAAMVMEDTYWEGEAPPSYVLGNLANAPSGLLGPMSGVFLLVGLYCVSASQLGAPLT